MHMPFGLEDIDELISASHDGQAWVEEPSGKCAGGLSRHRISSAIYYYFDNPNGGEAEYHVDTDYPWTTNWVPRVWDWKFGSLLWATHTPSFWSGEVEWDMQFDPYGESLEPFRRAPGSKRPLIQDNDWLAFLARLIVWLFHAGKPANNEASVRAELLDPMVQQERKAARIGRYVPRTRSFAIRFHSRRSPRPSVNRDCGLHRSYESSWTAMPTGRPLDTRTRS